MKIKDKVVFHLYICEKSSVDKRENTSSETLTRTYRVKMKSEIAAKKTLLKICNFGIPMIYHSISFCVIA